MVVLFCICQLLLTFVLGESDQSSNEDNDNPSTRSIKAKDDFQKKYRRFFQDLDDEEWHVAHLRDQDIDHRRSDEPCGPKTFAERAEKYRDTLKNDPGLIEYVSAYALPFNESKMEEEICKKLDSKDNMSIFNKASGNISSNTATHDDIKVKHTSASATLNPKLKSEIEIDTEDKGTQVTPIAPKTTLKQEDKVENKTAEKNRRSEYMFSSVEYYDETIDFDASLCPSAVEEITLDIDHIRNYDVECERIIEWRSLESAH